MKILLILFGLILTGCMLDNTPKKSKLNNNDFKQNPVDTTSTPFYYNPSPRQTPTNAPEKDSTIVQVPNNETTSSNHSTNSDQNIHSSNIPNSNQQLDNQTVVDIIPPQEPTISQNKPPRYQIRNCIIQPVNSVGGIEETFNAGQTWASCRNYGCVNDYSLVNSVCVKSKYEQSCKIENGTGFTQTIDGGKTWSSCKVKACSPNYTIKNDYCIKIEQTRKCENQPENSNGGVELTQDAGQNWSVCVNFTCNENYINVNGVCKKSIQSRSCTEQPLNSIGGIETSSDGGLTWESCTEYTCKAGYTSHGGFCQLKNQTRTCKKQPPNSIGGTEKSIDAGQNWSKCLNYICKDGYELKGNQCLPKIPIESQILDPYYYVKKFNTFAEKYNVIPRTNYEIKIVDFGDQHILGQCRYSQKRQILLSKKVWESPNIKNIYREYLLFHELAHCVLDRSHTDLHITSFNNLLIPKSIMNSSITNINHYNENYEYYIEELFNPNTLYFNSITNYYMGIQE